MKPTIVYSVLFFMLVGVALKVIPGNDAADTSLTSVSMNVQQTTSASVAQSFSDHRPVEYIVDKEPVEGEVIAGEGSVPVEGLAIGDVPAKEKTHFEEIDFAVELTTSDTHLVAGIATSNIGEMAFASELKPSNEVLLSLNVTQAKGDGVEMRAYLDLANFTMELDGANAVLNKEHKLLMETLVQQLGAQFELQYKDYDFPDHALMLLQMLSYWSVSPEGYVHEKREIVANY